jgi:hypothetical protein
MVTGGVTPSRKLAFLELDTVDHTCNLSTQEAEEGDHQFEASLGNITSA